MVRPWLKTHSLLLRSFGAALGLHALGAVWILQSPNPEVPGVSARRFTTVVLTQTPRNRPESSLPLPAPAENLAPAEILAPAKVFIPADVGIPVKDQAPVELEAPVEGKIPKEAPSSALPQAPEEPAEVVGEEPLAGSWVKARVEEQKLYPGASRARKEQGRVEVTFTLTAEGNLREPPLILRSSGVSRLDAAALDAVRRAAPFYPGPSLEVQGTYSVTLVFRLSPTP